MALVDDAISDLTVHQQRRFPELPALRHSITIKTLVQSSRPASPLTSTMTVSNLSAYTTPSPSKPPLQPQSASSAKRKNKVTPSTSATFPVPLPLLPPLTHPCPMTSQHTFPYHPANLLIHHLPNHQISLIDLSWCLPTLSASITPRSFPLRLIHDGIAYTTSLPTEVLCSTPSDFRSAMLNPNWSLYPDGPKEDSLGLVLTSLRNFGLESEDDVKTILEYMQSGRFNSATHNGGVYTVDRCIRLLALSSRYAMVRIVDLILIEMEREFTGVGTASSAEFQSHLDHTQPPQHQNPYHTTHLYPIDLSPCHLNALSLIQQPPVHTLLATYCTTIFRTPKGQRVEAKAAIETCIQVQGEHGEGSSMLQRIIQIWFKENPNPNRVRREGELAKLRALKVKKVNTGAGLGIPGRSESVLSTGTAESVGGTPASAVGRDLLREVQGSASPTPKGRSRPASAQGCNGGGEDDPEGVQYDQDTEDSESGSEEDKTTQDGKKRRRMRRKKTKPEVHPLLQSHLPL